MQGWDLDLFFEVLLCHKIAKAAGIYLCRFQLGPSKPQQMDPGSNSIMKSIHALPICIYVYIYICKYSYMLLRPLHCCTTTFGCPLDHTFWVQLQLGLDGSCHRGYNLPSQPLSTAAGLDDWAPFWRQLFLKNFLKPKDLSPQHCSYEVAGFARKGSPMSHPTWRNRTKQLLHRSKYCWQWIGNELGARQPLVECHWHCVLEDPHQKA